MKWLFMALVLVPMAGFGADGDGRYQGLQTATGPMLVDTKTGRSWLLQNWEAHKSFVFKPVIFASVTGGEKYSTTPDGSYNLTPKEKSRIEYLDESAK